VAVFNIDPYSNLFPTDNVACSNPYHCEIFQASNDLRFFKRFIAVICDVGHNHFDFLLLAPVVIAVERCYDHSWISTHAPSFFHGPCRSKSDVRTVMVNNGERRLSFESFNKLGRREKNPRDNLAGAKAIHD
jgi:hypothetical protein